MEGKSYAQAFPVTTSAKLGKANHFRFVESGHTIRLRFPDDFIPFQFSERLRRNYTVVHKTMGYLYIAGCYLGAPVGLYIQWFEERLGESRNFTIATVADATIWIFATTIASGIARVLRRQ